MRGPLEGKDYPVELMPALDLGGYRQSLAFIIIT